MKSPKGKQIDHIDGNPFNNKKSNLRIVTGRQNAMNRAVQSNNKLGIKGVTLLKTGAENKYRVTKTINRKQKLIGRFSTIEEAEKASIEADLRFFGIFSRFKKE